MKNETKLELKGDREVHISRMFNAPPRIVFEAWTRADLVRRWWAPKSHGVQVDSCDADVRVGGKYRYVLRRAEGDTFAFFGEYREIVPPSKLVYTQIFEPFPDAPVTITVTFEAQGERTLMVSREVYPSAQAREGALASGMESGMRETMAQLDVLVASLG